MIQWSQKDSLVSMARSCRCCHRLIPHYLHCIRYRSHRRAGVIACFCRKCESASSRRVYPRPGATSELSGFCVEVHGVRDDESTRSIVPALFALQPIPVAVADDVARECWIIHVCIIVTQPIIRSQDRRPGAFIFPAVGCSGLTLRTKHIAYIAKPIRTGHRTSVRIGPFDRHFVKRRRWYGPSRD